MAVLGLRFCARAFSSCGKRGPLFIGVRGPLTIAASVVAEHRLQTRRLSSCGPRAQPLRGTWDPPRPGPEPVSPALAGRLSTTAPPGKPGRWILNHCTTREVPKAPDLITILGSVVDYFLTPFSSLRDFANCIKKQIHGAHAKIKKKERKGCFSNGDEGQK